MQLTDIRRFIFLLLFSLMAYGIGAQAQPFQRLFSAPDRVTVNLGCEDTNDGGFYLINYYGESDQSAFGLNITKHDPKGNLNWANDYEIRNTLYYIDFRRSDIISTANDTIIICGNILNPADALGNGAYLLKIEPTEGEVEASIQINNSAGVNGVNSWVRLLNGFNSDFYYMDTHVDGSGVSYVTIERMDNNLNSVVGSSFRAVDDDGNATLSLPFDLQARADSSLVAAFAGSADTTLTEIGIAVFDTTLNAQFSYDYTLDAPAIGQQVFGMTTTPDTGTVVLTSFTDPVLMTPSSLFFKLDSLGNVEWAKEIGPLSDVALSFTNELHYNQFGELVVMGKSIDFTTFAASDFALFFDTDGNIIRQKLFENPNSFFLDLTTGLVLLSGNLDDSNDGHTYYSTTGVNVQLGGVLTPLVFKMDSEGSAICEDTLIGEFITDVTLSRDTVVLVNGDVTSRDTLMTGVEKYNDYDVPIVQLQDTFFCPQDPIEVTLSATATDAISYLWSTGDTTATLDVFEEGEYIVTVTFEDRVCFTLCDTATITQREFPEASITPDVSVPCEVTLVPGSTTDIVLAVWSTGDTVNRLTVTEPGTYTVTITDSCENTSEDVITIGEGNFVAVPNIVTAPNNPCEGDDIELSIDSNIPIDTYSWSTGEDTPIITIVDPGVYSVTLFDICGNEVTTSIEISFPPVDLSPSISLSNARLCEDSVFDLEALVSNQTVVQSYQWSSGESTAVISPSEAGTYSVTVTDECDNTGVAEITIDAGDFDISFTASILEEARNNCGSILTASNTAVFQPVTYTWSTGATSETIEAAQPGTYSVTVDDGCTTETATIEVVIEDFLINIRTDAPLDPETCEQEIFVQVPSDGRVYTQLWSTGETSRAIVVDSEGVFSVTVTDGCVEVSDTLEIEFGVVQFPNVFFPNSGTTVNKTFKPFVGCPDFFDGENYELKVYNRWGNLVWETTNIGAGWNGTFDGNDAPSAVYMYHATWTSSIGDESASGNVTLSR